MTYLNRNRKSRQKEGLYIDNLKDKEQTTKWTM